LALLPVGIRLSILPWVPALLLYVHDEFSHFLYAEGLRRLWNIS
jgi:hypothetical protein